MPNEDNKSSNSRQWIGCGLIVAGFLICAAACAGLLIWFSSQSGESIWSSELVGGDYFNQVAVIDINGEILGGEVVDLLGNVFPDPVEAIESQLSSAASDPTVNAVILRFNTPGGTVYDSFVLADAVREFSSNSGKPIVSVVETSAASGGYLIASQTDYIFSQQTSVIGSIGVLAQVQDTSGLLEKLGIKNITITSDGTEKKAGEGLDDPNSPVYQDLKQMLNDYQYLFEDYVAAGRGFNEREITDLADGSVVTGVRAIDLGLVDEFGDVSTAVSYISQELGLETTPRVFVYTSSEYEAGWVGIINNLVPGLASMRQRGGVEFQF